MKVEALLKRALIKAHLTVSCHFVCVMFTEVTIRVMFHYKSRLKPQSHALHLFFIGLSIGYSFLSTGNGQQLAYSLIRPSLAF